MSASRPDSSFARDPASSRLSRLDTTTTAQSESSATTPTLSTTRSSDREPSNTDEDDISAAAYRDLANSQASLLRATAALEETFSRIRVLRDHIAARRNGASTAAEGEQTSDASMGPDHNAIVLSGSEPERRRTISETIAIIEDLRAQLDARRPESVMTTLRAGRAALEQAGPRTAPAGGDTTPQPQTRRTSSLASTAPLRFGPRPESSIGQSRPQPRHPLLESRLRPHREASSSTDPSTTLGRRVAARVAGGQSGSSQSSRWLSLNDIMEDLRREMPDLIDRIRWTETPDAGERNAHWISQQNMGINNLVQEARALGVPIDSETTAGERSTERTDATDFPSPVSSSWFSPNPPALATAQSSLPTNSTDGAALAHVEPVRRSRGNSDSRPTFAEQIAQLNADMDRQRERRNRVSARLASRVSNADVSTNSRDERGPARLTDTVSRARFTAEQLAMESRLVDALENFNSTSTFETLRNIAMREPGSVPSDLEDDDPFSWLMPSRTPPAREAESRRTGRSIWQTSGGRAPQAASAYTHSDSVGVFVGRPRRDRGTQGGAAPASGRGDVSSANVSSSRRRRRGWARLDHDGNEIPTDEEEEYERNRAQLRSRAIQLTAGPPPDRPGRDSSTVRTQPLPPPPPAGRRLSFVPTTQRLFWPNGTGDSDIRVRINAARDLPSDSDRPITPRDESDEEEYWRDVAPVPQTIGSSTPFVPSLLPLAGVNLSAAASGKVAKPIRIADPMPIYCAGR